MKKCLAAILALCLLLAGAGALAEVQVDTTQLNAPFSFSFEDFKTSIEYWHANLSTASWSGWGEPFNLDGGYSMSRYTVDQTFDVTTVSKDGAVYAILMDYSMDYSNSDTSDAYSLGNTAGQELALVLTATETPGVNDDNLMSFVDFIARMQDGSFAQEVQTAWTSVINLSGESSSTPLNGNTLSSCIELSSSEMRFSIKIAYSPEAYVF